MDNERKEQLKEVVNFIKLNATPSKMGKYLAQCGVTDGKEHILFGGSCALLGAFALGIHTMARSPWYLKLLSCLSAGYGIWELLVGVEAQKQVVEQTI